jgi:hypothetical protein
LKRQLSFPVSTVSQWCVKRSKQRARHLGVYENARPFAKSKIGRYDDRSAFIKLADQVEQQLTAGLGKGEIAEFVEDNEVPPGEIFGDPSLSAATRLSLKPVDEIDGVVESAMFARANATASNSYGEMSLAGTGPANQNAVALLREKIALSEIAHETLVDGRASGRRRYYERACALCAPDWPAAPNP